MPSYIGLYSIGCLRGYMLYRVNPGHDQDHLPFKGRQNRRTSALVVAPAASNPYSYPRLVAVPPVSIYAQELYVELEFRRIHSEERRAVFWFLYTYCGNR